MPTIRQRQLLPYIPEEIGSVIHFLLVLRTKALHEVENSRATLGIGGHRPRVVIMSHVAFEPDHALRVAPLGLLKREKPFAAGAVFVEIIGEMLSHEASEVASSCFEKSGITTGSAAKAGVRGKWLA
uniref:Uncharacterized protein n=1 Tax=Gibberella zeae TaxID=5518 RepID=A0A4E9E0W0_GIBZA